jgi:NADH-ubiquinone oxidoreductase chain 4
MVLAGLVLKLATYGMIRILLPILPEARYYYSPLAYTLALISIIFASLSSLRQTDFKCLIAYSSVAHMGLVVLGIFSNSIIGLEGAIILSIAHGLVSPALFFIVGGILYDRYHTRIIRYYRGLTTYLPITMIFLFLFTLANIGTPGLSLN